MVSRCSYTSQYEFNVFEEFFVIINKTKSKKVSSTHLAARRKMNENGKIQRSILFPVQLLCDPDLVSWMLILISTPFRLDICDGRMCF